MTVEIDNEWINDLLAAKMNARQTVCPETRPKFCLGWGHFAAKLFGKSMFFRCGFLSTNGEFYGFGLVFHWVFPWVIVLLIV